MSRKKLSVRFLVAVVSFDFRAFAGSLAGAYIDSSYLDSTKWTPSTFTPWNTMSHWIQPWRAYQTTVPASQFINGVGINFNVTGLNAAVAAEMLAKHGFKRVRINVGWGNLDYETESTLIPAGQSIIDQLVAAKTFGLRPLLIVNDDQAVPCPFKTSSPLHKVVADAAQGAMTVQLDGTTDLKPGYSGISYLTSYTMNQVLITAIDSTTNTVTLSQPLPKALSSGQTIETDTFKYVPFDGPTDNGGVSDPYYDATQQATTLAGWNKYLVAIANIAAQNLGTNPGDPDMGFDMELWNEVTFDTQFLSLRSYYGQAGDYTNFATVIQNIATNTASTLNNNPTQFSGVVLEDGFANESINSSAYYEPARVGALGKHLYPQLRNYPHDEVGPGDYMLNALLQLEAPD